MGFGRHGFTFALACAAPLLSAAQTVNAKPASLVQLDLSMEVATTADDGNPSAIHLTLKNVGVVAIDLPMPEAGCVVGGGGIAILNQWVPAIQDPDHGFGMGGMVVCGASHFPPLASRVHNEWIHLRPGDVIVQTANVRSIFVDAKPGAMEIWAVYTPPDLTAKERADLDAQGLVVPAAKLETDHQSYNIQ